MNYYYKFLLKSYSIWETAEKSLGSNKNVMTVTKIFCRKFKEIWEWNNVYFMAVGDSHFSWP